MYKNSSIKICEASTLWITLYSGYKCYYAKMLYISAEKNEPRIVSQVKFTEWDMDHTSILKLLMQTESNIIIFCEIH